MPLDPRLFEVLVCTGCHGKLRELDEDRGLECLACGRVYPIRDGIPVMMIDQASPPTGAPGTSRPDRENGET